MIYLLLLLLSYSSIVISSGDPIETIVSNFMLNVRSLGEKWLSTVTIPKLEDVNNNPNIAYSVDAKTANALTSFGNFLNTCPIYLPLGDVEGTWYLVYASKKLMETTLNDVHQVIDRLSSSKPLLSRKSLDSLFRSPLELQCAQITILNSGTQQRFEWSYTTNGLPHSIIGSILSQGDRSIILSFAPTSEIKMAVAWSSDESIVFSQIDTWPPCDNHFIFTRNRYLNTTILRERLTLQGANLPSNPLQSIQCNANIKPIISPVPSSSSSSSSSSIDWYNKPHPWSSQSIPSSSFQLNNPSQSISSNSIQSIPPPYPSQSILSNSIQSIPRISPSSSSSRAQIKFNQIGRGYVEVIDSLY